MAKTKVYKVSWDWSAVVEAKSKIEAEEKAYEIWHDEGGDNAHLVAKISRKGS